MKINNNVPGFNSSNYHLSKTNEVNDKVHKSKTTEKKTEDERKTINGSALNNTNRISKLQEQKDGLKEQINNLQSNTYLSKDEKKLKLEELQNAVKDIDQLISDENNKIYEEQKEKIKEQQEQKQQEASTANGHQEQGGIDDAVATSIVSGGATIDSLKQISSTTNKMEARIKIAESEYAMDASRGSVDSSKMDNIMKLKRKTNELYVQYGEESSKLYKDIKEAKDSSLVKSPKEEKKDKQQVMDEERQEELEQNYGLKKQMYRPYDYKL